MNPSVSSPSNTKIQYALLVCFGLFTAFPAFAEYTIYSQNGIQMFCFPDTTITVVLSGSSPNKPVSKFLIAFCDGCSQVELPGSTPIPATLSHSYSLFSRMQDSCLYDVIYTPFSAPGYVYDISLLVIYTDGTTENNSFRIIFRIPPQPAFEYPGAICKDHKAIFTSTTCPMNDLTISTSWVYGDGIFDNTGEHIYNQAGLFPVALTVTNQCGSATYTQQILVLDVPGAEILTQASGSANQDTICLGDTIFLIGSASLNATTFKWYCNQPQAYYAFVDSTSDTHPNPALLLKFPGEYVIILEANNPCNVADRDTIRVRVLQKPNITLTHQVTACQELSYRPTPYYPEAVYKLNGIQILSSADTLLLASPTPYVLTVSLHHPCGDWFLTDTFWVVQPTPISFNNPSEIKICTGSAAIPLSTDYPIPAEIQYFSNGIQISALFYPTVAGNYMVEARRGFGFCQTADTIRITVEGIHPLASDVTFCDKTQHFALQSNPDTCFWYSLQCPGCITADGEFLPGSMPGSQVTVFCKIKTLLGCEDSTAVSVQFSPPVANFHVVSKLCANLPLEIDASGSAGDAHYLINHLPVSLPLPALMPGDYVIGQIVTVLGGCSDTLEKSITILPLPPQANYTTEQNNGCTPAEIKCIPLEPEQPGFAYQWSFSGSLYSGYIPPPQYLDAAPGDTANMSVVFSIGNLCGVNETTQYLTAQTKPLAIIGVDFSAVICHGGTVVFGHRTRGMFEETIWVWGDNSMTVSSDSIVSHIFYAPDSTRHYRVMLIDKNNCGSDTAFVLITVYPPDLKALFQVSEANPCPGADIQFFDAHVTGEEGTVIWDFDDGTFSTERNPIHHFTEPDRIYHVRLIIQGHCASDTIWHDIHTKALPPVGIVAPQNTVCENETIELTAAFTGNPLLWETSTGIQDSTHTIFHCVPGAGGHEMTVRLTAFDLLSGCPATAEMKIFIRRKPSTDVGFEKFVCLENGTFHVNISSPNSISGQIDFGDGTVSNQLEEEHLYQVEGKYAIHLTVSDAFCSDTLFFPDAVEVLPCSVYMANIFQPGTGSNGRFWVQSRDGAIRNIRNFHIFNRWGNLVFSEADVLPNDPAYGWDGEFGGQPASPGVYVWLLSVQLMDGRNVEMKSDVTLIR